jgi:hypothetical protein
MPDRWKDTCKAHCLDEDEVRDVYDMLREADREWIDACREIRERAMPSAGKLHRAFRGGDHDSIVGLDSVAQELTGQFPWLDKRRDETHRCSLDAAAAVCEILQLTADEIDRGADHRWRQAIDLLLRQLSQPIILDPAVTDGPF